MRIGLIAPPWIPVPPPAYGGSESVIDRLARGLVRAGHDVLLAAAANSTCPVDRVSGTEPAADGAPANGGAVNELRHIVTSYAAMADVDVVQLYDAFTINAILFLEDLGFCAKGEGGPFVASGAIAPGGALPVNTNGGGLSCVHPGMYGLFALVEGVRQLRGDAANPISGAEIALVHTNGGTLSSQATAILARAA